MSTALVKQGPKWNAVPGGTRSPLEYGHYWVYQLISSNSHVKYCQVFVYWGLSQTADSTNGPDSSICSTIFIVGCPKWADNYKCDGILRTEHCTNTPYGYFISVISMSLEARWVRDGLIIIGRALAPLPALAILFLVMLHRQMGSPYKTMQYILWFSPLGIGRGVFAFQSAMESWFAFRFVEGVESIGASKSARFSHI